MTPACFSPHDRKVERELLVLDCNNTRYAIARKVPRLKPPTPPFSKGGDIYPFLYLPLS